MSSGLHAELQALSKRADSLQVAAVDLAESVAYLLRPGAFGDWTLVDDSFPPLPEQEFRALLAIQRFHGPEDGIPGVPEECVRLASRCLTCEPIEVTGKISESLHSRVLCSVSFVHWNAIQGRFDS